MNDILILNIYGALKRKSLLARQSLFEKEFKDKGKTTVAFLKSTIEEANSESSYK